MSLENYPMFTAMNDKEVKPPKPPCVPPLTSQESHFAIMQRVNMCIDEVGRFEERVHREMESFMISAGAENTAFKEAIQASYNAFMQTVQHEISNFKETTHADISLHWGEIDTAFMRIQNDYEALKITLNNGYMDFKAEVNNIVNIFKVEVNERLTAQDGKIEAYKNYMVDNLPASVKAVFDQKAQNGEIASIMKEVYGDGQTFKGSLSYAEIQAIADANNGDYYYCTTDSHYYKRTENAWVDIGTGDKIATDYEAYKISNTKDVQKIYNQVIMHDKNILPGSYLSLEYNGLDLYKQMSFIVTLDKGTYRIIIPDTNAIGVMVSETESSTRLAQYNRETPKFFDFTIADDFAGKNFVISFNVSYDTPNVVGTYYAYVYAYKLNNENKTVIDYMVNNTELLKSPLITACNPIVKHFKGISTYYYGEDTYSQHQLPVFEIEAGNYKLILNNNDFIGVYIFEYGSNQRLLGKTYPGKRCAIPFTITEKTQIWVSLNKSFDVPSYAGTYTCSDVIIYKDNDEPFLPNFLTRYDELVAYCNEKVNSINTKYDLKDGYLSVTAESVASGATLAIPDMVNVKKNKTLVFTGKFESFKGLCMGHGKTAYGGTYLTIDETNLEVYDFYTESTKTHSVAHGMTFNDFVTVIVNVGVEVADITIMSATGMQSFEGIAWSGCNGEIFVEAVNCNFTHCELKWTTADINKPVWVFGDSYLGLSNPARYPKHLFNMGFKNWLACGYPGGSSHAELQSVKTLLKMGTPKVLVWCLGMNNGDTTEINTSWLYCVEEIKKICEENKIELVLATIPTCPSVNNTYKNEYVRNSSYRYVDFNKAVGVNGTAWYDGMLSADNVHPAELGAKALAVRFVLDVPEITH